MRSCDQAPDGNTLCSFLTLRRQSWVTILFWQAGIALLLWGFTAFLHRTHDSSYFDQAGRQRLLAQQVREHLQMVKERHREDRARLLEHAELFEKGLSELERDLKEQARWQSPGEPEAALAALRSLWNPYRPQLERLSRLPPGAKDFSAAYGDALDTVPKLAEASDVFMKAEVAQNQAEVRRFRGFILVLGAMNLLVSLLGLLAAYRCFLRPLAALQDAIMRFEGGDFSARVEQSSRGEMMSLIAAFNSMAQSVERNSSQLRGILDNSPAVIFVKDLEGRYLFVNRRYETMFHQAPGTMQGKTDLDIFPKEAAEKFREFDQEVLRRGEPMTRQEDVPHDDGPEAHYLSVKFPLRDSSGAAYGVCGIATDITEQKLVEEQLRQSQKMDAVGRLAGGVAHDFNNILTAILGYCNLLRGQVTSATARADLDEIKASGERAAALTQQLLAFSRKQALSPKVLDLNAIVADTERMLKRVIGENVVLNCRLFPEQCWVKADKSQLEQVILNLTVNARDAMPGGGNLTIETASRELGEEYCGTHPEARPGRYAMLAVTDTGMGMDARTLARIFEPFFTTKELGRGTGLGLSMVYGIARQSGGHVAVQSEPGRGACFQVYLPIVTEAPETEKKAPASAHKGAGAVVLLVEDEEPLRRLVVRLLSQSGYSVLEAGDAESALALFQDRGSEIRLLLTDVVLPKNNGRWLAEKLRELKPSMGVLYTSGYTDEVIAHHGAPDAGSHFLAKPFTAEGLLSAVHAALDV